MSSVKLLGNGFYNQLGKITGAKLEDHPLWAARFLKDDEEAFIQANRDTIRAGTDLVTTGTYQGSVTGFQKYMNLSEEEGINLIKRSVYLARKAIELERPNLPEGERDKELLVYGSVGSYGAWLHDGSEYRGEFIDSVSTETLRTWHIPRIQALIEAGVDIIAFETIPAIEEAEILLNIIKDYPSVKTWISFTCKDNQHISRGNKLSDAASRCWEVNSKQLLAVGANCLHPSLVVPLLKSVRDKNPEIPLICYPNTEEIFDLELKEWVGKEKCQPVVNYLDSFLDLKIEYIGGCCRTNLQDLKEFRQHIDNKKKEEKAI